MLVTGASGFIGSHLIRALLHAGHEVRACARDAERLSARFPDTDCLACDFRQDLDAQRWLPRVRGMDAVVNAAGIIRESGGNTFSALHTEAPRALFDACASAGVPRVVQISALGADAQASSRFHLSKKAADDHLAGLALAWAIVQPSIVYGPGGKSFALLKVLAALPVLPLIADGGQRIQPIHVDDLVRGIVQLIENPEPLHLRLAAVGPDPIAMAEILIRLRAWLDLPRTRTLHVPLPLVRLVARAGDALGQSASETLDMLLRGNTADPQPWVQATGVKPRSLDEALRAQPAEQADRWHARLYFLKPLLKLSIAFVWIAAGLVSAFAYPVQESYALLARTGIPHSGPWGWLAPLTLYGAAALDLILGIATLASRRFYLAGLAQLAVMTGFSLIIAIKLPEFWLHPFGPLVKNLPLAVAILMMMAMEDRR